MLSPQQLKTAITTGELASELVGPGKPWTLGQDAIVADVLNRADRPGYVPARHAAAELLRALKWGLVEYIVRFAKMPDGTLITPSLTETPGLYDLFATFWAAANLPVEPPIRLEVGPLASGLNAVSAFIPAPVRTAILAGEVKTSYYESLTDYGSRVSPAEVEAARKS